MSMLSRIIARIGKLPPAETHDVLVERDLQVPMPDEVLLLADRYAPRGVEKPPLILVRCCYGRRGLFGLLFGQLFAERGFQVVIQPGGALAPDLPPTSEPDHYRYDPADPTPQLSGPLLAGKALPADNRSLEARSDVLTYTSAPLDQDLEVIGPVQADPYVKSSLEHTDFFARLCDVDVQGKSINVCDALLRIVPGRPAPEGDGALRVIIDLWPTAHCFRTGHCLRLQVSSGAHPRFARNTGSGEPLATATKLLVANQSIYHDPRHPSGIVLSILH